MKSKIFYHLKIIIFLLVVTMQLVPEQLLAAPSGGLGRIRECSKTTGQIEDSDGLNFDPFSGGKDSEWVLSNPVCGTLAATAYVATKTAIHTMNSYCGNPRPIRPFPSIISDIGDIGRCSISAASTGNASCTSAVVGSSFAFTAFMGVLSSVYAYANDAYLNTKICGHGWYGPNTTEFNLYNKDYENRTIEGYPAAINSTKKIISACRDEAGREMFGTTYGGKSCDTELDLVKSKHYREYFYGGVEVEDNPDNENQCRDPYVVSTGDDSGYATQKYYMKGFEEANYNCQKYDIRNGVDPSNGEGLTTKRKKDFKEAYECCTSRAKNYVCINYKGTRKFCRADSNCVISKDALFVNFATQSHENGAKICVETFSLCPYNFYISGGSDVCDYFQDGDVTQEMISSGKCSGANSEVRNDDCSMKKEAGKCKNYCQYMTHCTKTSSVYSHTFSDASPYFSTACIDLAGDSRNRVSFGTGFFQGSMRHFSTPIVQCFKETLENLFHNRAGHTRCLSTSEDNGLDITGICPAGFAYKEGEKVYEQSFFETFQKTMTSSIRVFLSLVIMFYGMKILTGRGEIKKKDLMMLIVKIAVVMYFATGSAWKDMFFDGIYNTSSFFSELVLKVQTPEREDQRDGCQFGKVYASIKSNDTSSTNAYGSYPEGKSYLSVWDTLDCKVARYLGFGPEASVANIALLVVAGMLVGTIGSYFVTCIFLFAMLVISTVIRAVHIFVASSMAIIILIFISPITITCILTEKTKSIFTNWLKQLLSYAIQPMILFVYLAVLVSILDRALVGSAVYTGDAPSKVINCEKYCVEENGSSAKKADGTNVAVSDCIDNNRKVINPQADSLECMINADSYSRFPGLEQIGISIPFLLDFFLEEPKKKMLTLIRGLLVLYFLYKFMDEVPNIASQLFGGSKLPMSGTSVESMHGKVLSRMKGFQKRGARGTKKAAGGIKRSVGNEMSRGRSKKEASDEDSGNDK